MKLLVTNDDGIDSLFLHELVGALLRAGQQVNVVAPVTEQSWTGASKTRTKPVRSAAVDRGLGCPTWMVDGTPSDCVNIALAHLVKTPIDGVVTERNVHPGALVGPPSGSSGAGAWEGAIHGLPAVAFSQDVAEDTYNHLKEHGGNPDGELLATLKIAAAHAAHLTPKFLAATPRHSFTVHNVNFPTQCRADTPLRRTVPARLFVPGLFSPRDDDGTHRLIWKIGEDVSPKEPLTDRACLAAGLISHTVLDYTRLGHA